MRLPGWNVLLIWDNAFCFLAWMDSMMEVSIENSDFCVARLEPTVESYSHIHYFFPFLHLVHSTTGKCPRPKFAHNAALSLEKVPPL